jgi:TRAP-type C4-dicarboxylate transport system permease small subunit
MEGTLTAMPATPLYNRFRHIIDRIDDVLMVIGCLMLFALMFVVVGDVVLRYLFNAPLQWSYEVISSYLMPGLFFFAASHTLKAHAHVAVDIVHNYVSRRTRYVLESLVSVLAAPVFLYCTVISAHHTWADLATAATSTSGLALPTWTVSVMLPIGFGMLTLRLILNAIGYIATLVSGHEVVPLPPISGTEELAS